MRGLALEGGGARGAYHIGVVKALYENGYEFDGFTGTSIGAINAAVLAQDDFDLALKLWQNISMEQLVDVDEQALFKLANIYEVRIDKQLPLDIKNAVKKIIGGKGLSTEKMKTLLEMYLSEEKLRKSGKDFGLVTVSLTERRPYELMLEDIPQGKLLAYIMASASFPGFRPEKIDDSKYVDGGFYNNCPINLLVNKGYDEIIAVRTTTLAIIRKFDGADKVKYITPHEDLGNMMWFAPEHSAKNIELGYRDGLRFLG